MFKSVFTILFLSVFTQLNAQFGFQRIDTITVINGTIQEMPWAGGLDYPQFSNIDLNWDGTDDLFIFDRSSDKVLTFIHSTTPNSTEYVYVPAFEELFPPMTDWALLVDYNCDGKMDIFTHAIGGGKVYKNIGDAGSGHQFELVKPNLKTWLWGNEGFMYISSVDIPAIVDIDGDSDIDVLSFGVGGQTVEYHKNMSMEMYGVCDSFYYETKNLCWGRFKESSSTNTVTLHDTMTSPCNNPIGNEEFVVPFAERGEKRHAGSTVLALDMNDNGVMDLVLGDIAYPNMTLLMNGGTAPNQNSAMISQDPAFPSNTTPVNVDIHPAGFHVDINNDGKRDLIAAPSSKVGSENREGVWYYSNSGTDLGPIFNYEQHDFFQKEMIEVGSKSMPVFFDHNADGLKDLLVSSYGMYDTVNNQLVSSIAYYENTGTLANPEFTLITDDYQNISSFGLGSQLVYYPAFGDLDNDGDEDMILGEYDGYLYFMENTGGAGNDAIFNTYIILNDNNASPIFEGTYAYPQLVDIDRDNDLDLILGKRNGKLTFYENTGNASIPIFTQITQDFGAVDVSEWWNIEGHAIAQFIDVDNEYHLVCGSKSGYLHYYDNIEGNLSGAWNLVDSTMENIMIGYHSAPAIYDLTDDYHLEMILGNQRGGVALYKSAPISDIGLEELNYSDLKIYPNPATDQLTIDLGAIGYEELVGIQITIYDISGKVIQQYQPTATLSIIDVSGISAGTYLIEIANGQSLRTEKVSLQ